MTDVTLYGCTANASVSTDDKLVSVTGATATILTTKVAKASGYGEVWAKGNTGNWPAGAGPPAASDHGFMWDVTTLEGQTLTGSQAPVITLNASSSLVATIYVLISKRSSAGAFTTIGTCSLAAQTISTGAVYTITPATFTDVNFAAGDKLVMNVWLNITTPSGSNTGTVGISVGNSSTQGTANCAQLTTHYIPTIVTGTRTMTATCALLLEKSRTITTVTASVSFIQTKTVGATASLMRPATGEYATAVLAKNPLCYYRLDEATGTAIAFDSSGNSRHGSITGTGITVGQPGLISGDTNTSYNWPAAISDSYISCPSVGIVSGSWTIEAWVYLVGAGSVGATAHADIIAIGSYSSARVKMRTTDGLLSTEQGGTYNSTNLYALNTLHHVILTWDGTVESFWVDGVQDSTFTPSSPPTWDGAFQIGSDVDNYSWNGRIDEVAIYPTALSPLEITTQYILGIRHRTMASSAPLLLEKNRTITTVTGTLLVEKSRTITTCSVALLVEKTNAVADSAALLLEKNRPVTCSVALLLEKNRSIGSSGALSLVGTRSLATMGSLAYLALTRMMGSSIPLLLEKTNTIGTSAALLVEQVRMSSSTVSLLLEKSRAVSTDAALSELGTLTRSVPCDTSLSLTKRDIGSSAALLLEQGRTMGSSAAFSLALLRSIPTSGTLVLTQSRSAGSSATLLVQKANVCSSSVALSLLGQAHTIPVSGSLTTPGTSTRTTPTSVALSLAVRTIPASVSVLTVSTRTLAGTVALGAQGVRTVPLSGAASLQQVRSVGSSSALLATKTRTVTGSVACSLSSLRTIASSAALSSVGSRSIPSGVALLASQARRIPASTSLLANRVIPGSVALLTTSARSMPTSADLGSGYDHIVPCSVALSHAGSRPIPASVILSLFIANARVTVPSGYASLAVKSGAAFVTIE